MLDNYQIVRILNEAGLLLKHNFDSQSLRFVDANQRNYNFSEFAEFKRDLIEAGSKVQFLFLEYMVSECILYSDYNDSRLFLSGSLL